MLTSQSAMAALGETRVLTRLSARPGRLCTSSVTSSSACAWLPASITNSKASRSIQTRVLPCLVKAIGSSSSRMSSLMSRVSFLPGLRPVLASIWSTRSCALRFTTEAGRARDSTISVKIHWPATTSSSGPLASPRGSIQPTDFSWDAPHATKWLSCRWASTSSAVRLQPEAMRYMMTFLNTADLFLMTFKFEAADHPIKWGPVPPNRCTTLQCFDIALWARNTGGAYFSSCRCHFRSLVLT